ncbi:hypothetical protein FTUN_7656 [Frigoriglobus tundricola]|uniref:Uncharacterized protein n=1 Tax=Frigoriglobus tundricola TaxID=2774151 RepID=A0A6M5Z3I1_9BACT|nr:hypothetical protein FTUN_7656 [Frigoriglobus tundricola]
MPTGRPQRYSIRPAPPVTPAPAVLAHRIERPTAALNERPTGAA